MRELAFLNKGLKISVNDLTLKKEKSIIYKFDGGILEFVNFLDEKREKLKNKNGMNYLKNLSLLIKAKNNMEVECAYSGTLCIQKMYILTQTIYFKKMEEHIY